MKILPAISALERLSKSLALAPEDQKRCAALVKLLRSSSEGRLRYEAVLDAVFPVDQRPKYPKNVFTKFRKRVAEAAAASGETFAIQVSGNKRSSAAAMVGTFPAGDAAASTLQLPANPHYRNADYTEQRASRPIKRIFLSNADADAMLVGQFMDCLRTTLRSDADERVRKWVDSIWWHRKDLT